MAEMNLPGSDVTVIKLGGSLMDASDLKSDLWSIVKAYRKCLIVPGGGAAADDIRRLDQLASLTALQSHWFAIEAMTFNAEVLVRTCGPGLVLVRSLEQSRDVWNSGRVAVLDPAAFLREEERAVNGEAVNWETVEAFRSLPASWDVTSDSIAAWVAHRCGVVRLVLAKSCERPQGGINEWASIGAVDAYFPKIATGLQIDWVNLKRSPL